MEIVSYFTILKLFVETCALHLSSCNFYIAANHSCMYLNIRLRSVQIEFTIIGYVYIGQPRTYVCVCTLGEVQYFLLKLMEDLLLHTVMTNQECRNYYITAKLMHLFLETYECEFLSCNPKMNFV